MTPIIHYMAQRTPEWYQARTGILTASVAGDISAFRKDGKTETADRRDLRTRLALERVTGQSQERAFDNADMQRGRELEADALAAYEGRSGQLVSAVGFVSVAELPIGCSPDGVVMGLRINGAPDYQQGDIAMYRSVDAITGGVDVKCPRAANHLAYLKNPASLVEDYESQMAHTLLVTGAMWWDLCSYCPQFPAVSQVLIVRCWPKGTVLHNDGGAGVPRIHPVDLAAHELNVRQFLREVDNEEAEIRRVSGVEAA